MLTASLLAATAATMVPQGQGSSTAPIVINEFSYDDSGANDRVFVELYNRTTGPVDISGWVLRGHDGTATGNGTVVIQPNTVLFPGEFFVVGQAAGVPNVDQDVPGMNTVLETGPDGLTLELPNGFVLDSVVWQYAGWTNPVPSWLEGDGLFGDVFNPDTNPQSASRVFDGYDSDSNGCDFRVQLWSPGSSNDAVHTVSPNYANTFDDIVGTTVAAEFNYSFVPGTVLDPTTLAVPPSPQGGNVSTWYDPAGGGNANYLNSESRYDWIVECYAYLRGPTPTMDSDDVETWAIGVRGSTDSFANPIDIAGLYAYAGVPGWAPGCTGIGYVMVTGQLNSNIYLVDFGDGGQDFNVLVGPISILADGWVRLRLSVIGNTVVCNVGGNYGCDDGNRFTTTGVTQNPGGVYIQYRENVSAAGAHRPLTLDALRFGANFSAAATSFGTGAPTTVGVPQLDPIGLPTVGNINYALQGSNLVPNGFSFGLMRIGIAALPGTQIPGAQPGAELYFDNNGAPTFFLMNSASGTAQIPLAIPCTTKFTGMPITAQIVDFDFALPYALPIGTSAALDSLIGN
ncbi:MAG: lamin tail domain-containing protein [Planctomycetes bacterium]|nr:lamin tail domain-containing protein [Planctomycetota bacterium]